MSTNLTNLGLENNPNLPDEKKAKIIASLLSSDPKRVEELETIFELILGEPDSFYDSLKDIITHLDYDMGKEILDGITFSVEQLRSLMLAVLIEKTKKESAAQNRFRSGGALS